MKRILIGLCLFVGITASAQTTTNQFSLNFLIPSAEYEVAVSDHTSIDALAGLGAGYFDSSSEESQFGVFPQFMGQYRFYYNFDKRRRKRKKTSENSANYIAAVATFASGDPIIGNLEFDNNYTGFVGPAWGLQRVYGGGFKLNLNLGLGYGFNDLGDSYLAPHIGLQLGWKLGR